MRAKKEIAGYELLVGSVVIQAARDYRKALCKLHKKPDSEKWQIMQSEVEMFFKGEAIMMYTNIDGERLMERIKDEVIKYDYDLKALNKAHREAEEEWL